MFKKQFESPVKPGKKKKTNWQHSLPLAESPQAIALMVWGSYIWCLS